MSIKQLKPKKKSIFKQGYFNVSNSVKYHNPNNEPCIYRSSYEFKFMTWCERTPYVLKWTSEPNFIEYLCLETGKTRKYWIDFQVFTDKPEKWLMEIKPSKEVTEAENFGRLYNKLSSNIEKQKFVNANKRAAKNWSKWIHAKKFCEQNNCRFIIVTENWLNKN